MMIFIKLKSRTGIFLIELFMDPVTLTIKDLLYLFSTYKKDRYLTKSDFGKWNPPPLSPNPETIRGRHNTIKQNFMSDLLGSLMKNEWKVLKKNSIVKLLSIWIDLFNVHTCAERKKVLRFVFWHFQCPLLKSFQHLTSYCMYWNSIM